MERVVKKLGSEEKVADVFGTFRALEQHRKPIGCVHDTADGMIISFMELGYSNRELKQLFKVGGYRLEQIRKELKDPTL